MIRLVLIDLFAVGGSLAAILTYYNNRKKTKNSRLIAHFVGGPLDGKKRRVSSYNSVYVYKDISQPGDALYKHHGDGIYSFDEFVA